MSWPRRVWPPLRHRSPPAYDVPAAIVSAVVVASPSRATTQSAHRYCSVTSRRHALASDPAQPVSLIPPPSRPGSRPAMEDRGAREQATPPTVRESTRTADGVSGDRGTHSRCQGHPVISDHDTSLGVTPAGLSKSPVTP